jgi:long-chain fatty acid transport protein
MKFIVIFIVLVVPLLLNGAGFKNYEIGARATALGGAFIAGYSDPTSIFYNPAAIASLEGTQFYLGGTYTSRRFAFSSPDLGGISIESESSAPLFPEFAITHRFNKTIFGGIGFHTSSYHNINWPTDGYNPVVYEARQLYFRTSTITPTIAFKLGNRFSLGASIGINLSSAEMITHYNYDMLMVQLTNGMMLDAQDFILFLHDCRSTFLSYGLGFQWKVSQRIGLAFTAEGSMGGEYNAGKVVFREPDTPFPELNQYLDTVFIDSPAQEARAKINDIVTLKWGISWKPSNRLTLEADFWIGIWQLFDTVSVKFKEPMVAMAGQFVLSEINGDYTWQNPVSIRVGAEYQVSPCLMVRFGAFSEPSPVQDEQYSLTFPFNDQWGIATGMSWKKGKAVISAAYRYLNISSRDITSENINLQLGGLYSFRSEARNEHLFSIGIKYLF